MKVKDEEWRARCPWQAEQEFTEGGAGSEVAMISAGDSSYTHGSFARGIYI